ncbi:unnamed protein product, partial [Dibothriocephalus latus]
MLDRLNSVFSPVQVWSWVKSGVDGSASTFTIPDRSHRPCSRANGGHHRLRWSNLHTSCITGKRLPIPVPLLQFEIKMSRIKSSDRHGKTPLQAATANGSVSLVHLLLQHGAEVDRADNYGTTALHIASKLQNEELIYLLMNFGASVYAKQERGRTPYEMYVSSGLGYLLSPSPVYNLSPPLSNGSASPSSSPQLCTSPNVMARLRSNSASRSLSRCNNLLFRYNRQLSGSHRLREVCPNAGSGLP